MYTKDKKQFIPLGPTFKYDLQIKMVSIGIVLTYWILLAFYLYGKLGESKLINKAKYSFMPYFLVIVIYPIIYYVYQIIVLIHKHKEGKLFTVDPFYSFCLSGPEFLTKKELKAGAIGKQNYKCVKQQAAYNNTLSKMLTDRAYTSVYSVFLLILFFLTTDAGKFKNTIERDNSFIASTIQHALFIALLLISSTLLKDYYYLSLYALDFLTDLLQILGALLILLVTFIIFRIILFYI